MAYGGFGNVTILAATLASGGTGVESGTSEMPATHRLYQNYPNPFNPSTQIVYELSVPSVVQIAIYDLSGREIRSLENGYQNAGHHRIVWDGRDKSGNDVVSGLYIARLRVGDFVQNQKMMLVR